MRRTIHRPNALVAAAALALILCTACSGQSSSSSSDSSNVSSAASSASSSLSASSSSDASPSPGKAPLDESSILFFQGDEGAERLAANMAANQIPAECNVLYDQMGSRPDVTVTDPATIAQIYDLVRGIQVIGPSGMSITDSYHHVSFKLQDGTQVGFAFEGEGNLVAGKTNYLVVGDSQLWSLVRRLQKRTADVTPLYSIAVTGDEGLISPLPKSAAEGDAVSFATAGVADGSLQILMDGKPLGHVPDYANVYAFAMPGHDASLTVRLIDDGAGS